jgi:hypothetical protein
MSSGDDSKKDKLKYEFNVFTENLDLVSDFNTNRIVTAERNSAGSKFHTFDPFSNQFIEDGPRVVINNAGNVVKI